MSRELTNKQVQAIRNLHHKTYRLEKGVVVIEGDKNIAELLVSTWPVHEVYAEEEWLERNRALLDKRHILYYQASDRQLERLSLLTTPQRAIAIAEPPTYDLGSLLKSQEAILFLDSIADPGNLGTILRTADWFGVKKVILGGRSADIFNEKVQRASMGSFFHLSFLQVEDSLTCLKEIQNAGYTLVVTTLEPKPELTKATQPLCLILGNEGSGVSAEVMALATHGYHIPGYGQAESLNVAVSCAICLYDLKVLKQLI